MDEISRALAKAKQDVHNLALQESDLDARIATTRKTDLKFKYIERLNVVHRDRLLAERRFKTLAEQYQATPVPDVELPAIYVQCVIHSEGKPTLFPAVCSWIDEAQSSLAAICPKCVEDGKKLREEKGVELAKQDAPVAPGQPGG